MIGRIRGVVMERIPAQLNIQWGTRLVAVAFFFQTI
jgi:hypothetical protein